MARNLSSITEDEDIPTKEYVDSVIDAHIGDTTDAHMASAIDYDGGTNVQEEIDNLYNETSDLHVSKASKTEPVFFNDDEAEVPVIVRAMSGTTANLQEWQIGITPVAYVADDGNIVVPDEAYGAGWDSSFEVPTKGALYAKIETLGSADLDGHLDETHGRSLDTFTRTTSGNIGDTETHGRQWLDGSNFQTTGGRLKKLAAGYSLQTFHAHNVQGRVSATIGVGATSEWWVVVRVVDANNYIRIGYSGSGDDYDCQKITAGGIGGFTQLLQKAGSIPLVANGDRVDVYLWGDDGIDVFINDEWIWSIGDTQGVNSDEVGVAINGTTPGFDEFSFTPTGGPATTLALTHDGDNLADVIDAMPKEVYVYDGTTYQGPLDRIFFGDADPTTEGFTGTAGDGWVPTASINEFSFTTNTANYTLALTDAGKIVEQNVASANNLTVPPNSSVPFSVGTEIFVVQYGAGATTIVAGSGVTLRALQGNLVLAGQYGWAKLIKRATDEWEVDVHGVLPGPRELARAVTVTAQTGIAGTPVDLNNLTISFTVDRYPVDVTLICPYMFTVTGGWNGSIEIYDDINSLQKQFAIASVPAAGQFMSAITVERITTPGTYSRKARATRSSGAGTMSHAFPAQENNTYSTIKAVEVAT